MFLFIPRSLCALDGVAAKADHPRFAATQGIRIALACGMYRAEATDGRRAVVAQGIRRKPVHRHRPEHIGGRQAAQRQAW